jgi:hypothetical protein
MEHKNISRRSVLKGGSAALAGLTLLHVTGPERAFGQSGAEVIPWLDQPGPNPVPGGVGNLLEWQQLSSWQTPAQNFFFVNHYVPPTSLDESTWRKVIDNVLLPLEIVRPHREQFRRRKQEYREKATALLKTVGLEGFADRFPWELSGGMQQRVSLCRALIHEPALLMLDEPFAALDAFTREELWCVLRDLWHKLGFTVILVTHDLREAAFLADKIHVMSARPGRIVMTKVVDLPRPRDLDICYEARFTDIVHELRGKIAEVRKA